MQVQINTGPRVLYNPLMEVTKLPVRGDIAIAIDPGKTNMAAVIGNPNGEIYAVLQFSGAGRATDTSDYCQDFKRYLKAFLANTNVYLAGIEAAISKKGMEYHYSSFTLTEIRGQLIDLFYSLTGHKPQELNNWAWKHYVLPEGYRSQSEKGSARFLKDWYEKYGNADVTDAVCMFMYLTRESRQSYVISCEEREEPIAPYQIAIYPPSFLNVPQFRRFVYNPAFSLQDNAIYYANRSFGVGIAEVSVDELSMEDIYKHAVGFTSLENITKVGVVVVRSSTSG